MEAWRCGWFYVPLGFSQPWDSDFRICFYSPARLLYWSEYIWGYFSSSKVIQRQPPHLPTELSVGTVDWLIERLTRRLHDSLCSIDAPKHVYHCVCRSKMTLLLLHLCKYSCKKWCTASRPSPQSGDKRAHTLWLSMPPHTLYRISTPDFKPDKRRRKLQMNSHYWQNQISWPGESPPACACGLQMLQHPLWLPKIKRVSSSFCK